MASEARTACKGRVAAPCAPIPRLVVESEAYQALPDWAVRVLVAVACQYNGRNNGSLGLTESNFKRLGIRAAWHVYAGLRLLEEVGLVVRTEAGGTPLQGQARYALTWRAMGPSGASAAETAHRRKATNNWRLWEQPARWSDQVEALKRAARGAALAVRARGDAER
jgi:hypothetical protein